MRNGLSVDVEDWFQVGAFENTIARDDWDHLESRVADNTARVLDLFAAAGGEGHVLHPRLGRGATVPTDPAHRRGGA